MKPIAGGWVALPAHCSAMDISFIIYPVVHVSKDQILATNTVDFRVVTLLRSIP